VICKDLQVVQFIPSKINNGMKKDLRIIEQSKNLRKEARIDLFKKYAQKIFKK